MQTFYHGLDNSARETMDAAAGGAFLSLTIPQATTLVEKVASNQGWNEEMTQTRERWRYAPTQVGTHVVCQARPAHEEAR